MRVGGGSQRRVCTGITEMAHASLQKSFFLWKFRVSTLIHGIPTQNSPSLNQIRFLSRMRKFAHFPRARDPNTYRGQPPAADVVDKICKLMLEKPWHTRLLVEIRRLVPHFSHSIVWNVLSRLSNAKACLQFFRWVERSGFRHDQAAHLKILQILGERRMLNHARCILLDMPNKGVAWHEKMFVAVMESYAKAGIIQEAVKFFWRMKEFGVEKTVYTYNYLFKLQMRRGRARQAKRYFNYMLEHGIHPTRHTYNVMIWGFFLCRQLRAARVFFEEMKHKGISPDEVTYNTMIYGYGRVHDIEAAEKYFSEMKEVGIMPTVATYTSLIRDYGAVGRVDDALRLFEEMKSVGIDPNGVTYSLLLYELCDAGKLSEAQNILENLVKCNLTPKNSSVFTKLLTSQCDSGDLDSAIYVLKAMHRLQVATEAGHYGMVIAKLCNAKNFSRAINLLDRLLEKELILSSWNSSLKMERSAYNPLIDYLCNHGYTKKAETLLRQLMKMGVLNSFAFNHIAFGHLKEGDPESAYVALKIMEKKGVRSEENVYRLLVESYLNKGEAAEAKRAFDSMIKNGHLPDSSLYRLVMDKLFEDGRVQTASQVMKTMVEKDVKENMDLVGRILEALFLRGHVEEAIGRVALLVGSGFIVDFNGLLSCLCEKSQVAAALQLAELGLERDCSISKPSFNKVLDALLAAERMVDAYTVLCKLKAKEVEPNWSHLEDLIKGLILEGNRNLAINLRKMVSGEGRKDITRKKEKKQACIA